MADSQSLFEQALAAEGVTGERADLSRAIFGQESRGNVKSATSNRGAVGGMQILAGTFKEVANPDWDINNPEHNVRAGIRYATKMYDRAGGDPRLGAIGYYSGPGGQDAAMRGEVRVDAKNPTAPTSFQYGDQVVGRMANKHEPFVYDPKAGELSRAIKAAREAPATTIDLTSNEKELDAVRENLILQHSAEPGLLETVGAALAGNTDARLFSAADHLINSVLRDRPEDQLDPTWRIPQADLDNADKDTLQELFELKNKTQYDKYKNDKADEQFRQQTLFSNGTGTGIALSFGAEIFSGTNILTAGAASIRAVGAAAKAASAGKAFNPITSAITENLLSGTAVEGAIQLASQRFDAQSLGISVMADTFLGAGAGYLAKRNADAMSSVERMAQTKILADASTLEKAKANLGTAHTQEELVQEFDRVRVEELKTPAISAITPSKPTEKLLPHPDEPLDEVPQVASTPEVAPAQQVPDEIASTESLVALPKELSKAAPRYSYGAEQFTLSFASDIDRAAYIVAGAKPSKRDADYLTFLRQAVPGASDENLRAYGAALRTTFKAEAKAAGEGFGKVRNLAIPDQLAQQARKAALKEAGPSLDVPVAKINANQLIDDAVPTAAMHPTEKVTVMNEASLSPELKVAVQAIKDMAHLLPPKLRIGVGQLADTGPLGPRGMVVSNANIARIALKGKEGIGRAVESATHEVTHVLNDFYFPNATVEQKAGIMSDYGKFVDKAFAGNSDAVLMRWADWGRSGLAKGESLDATNKYVMDLGEWMAEQGVRYFKTDAAKANTTGFTQDVLKRLVEWSKKVVGIYFEAKTKGYIPATKSFSSYMDDVVAGRIAPVDIPVSHTSYDKPAVTGKVNDFLTNPDAVRFNLTGLPLASKSDRADAEAMLGLRLKAEAWGKANPKDAAWDARSKNLANNDKLNVASTALTMLSSKDDLSRMLAHMLLEDASGVAGKRPMNSAALSKDTFHKLFLGNTTNDMQNSFAAWSKTRGGSFKDDYINGGQLRKKFDLEIAAEIEYRAIHKASKTTDPIVDAAVRSVHAAYERMRNAQIEHKTLGWAALPKEEVSYMPHSLMPGKVNALTPAQTDVLRSALTDQYVSISGWDISFSDQLSAAVVARVKARAVGGFETPLGGQNPGSAQIIEDALGVMGLDADTIRTKMKDFRKGAANFTKHRTTLDLNKEYPTPDGVFKLMDVYETDQLTLLRSQAGRVSGEVALAQQGIYGKPHMALLRKTMAQDAKTPQELKTLEAFDQIAAEFMHEPFGTVAHKNVERLRIMTALLRLGGIVYSQFAEFINMAFHIGGGRTLSAIGSVPRLRGEIIELAAGKKVNNPILSSIETFAGEFGTDAYKIVLPFDSMDHAYPTYGRDTLTMFDRLLRGGSHVQAKLSGWRALHAAQQRGVAEQIVAKMSRYVREGKEDKALESMGIDAALAARIKLDINKVATFGSNGNLVAFDMTKFTDPEVATATWQAVKRGTSQIIQGTFIGETGKWAHNDYLKVLTQFRTFSITSMEKQWGRQRNSRGQWEAVGMVMAAMSLAVPIHVARTYANSVGRKDQDAYLEKNLKIERVVRASMNYVAGAGMFPDLFDMAIAAAPEGAIKKVTGVSISGVTGGRPGADTTLMGSFAPAVGTAESVWKLLQNMDDIDSWEKMAPGNRHPFVVPLLNALGD